MDKRQLQTFAVWAKNNLEEQIRVSLDLLGIKSETDIKRATIQGDFTIIDADPKSYDKDLKRKRDSIIRHIQNDGYDHVIEEFAYTWFNRIIALRFMEVHDYLEHGYKIFPEKGVVEPEILSKLQFVKDDLNLDVNVVHQFKDNADVENLYKYLLFKQCNTLSESLPMLFSKEYDYLELLMPNTLLKGDTIITRLMEIDISWFDKDTEIIGWLYQFYVDQNRVSFRQVKKTLKEHVPSLTQVFTPDWISKILIDSSLGEVLVDNVSLDYKLFKDSINLKSKDNYKNVSILDIKILEPCCGSGHLLVEIFNTLLLAYSQLGYTSSEASLLILKNNIIGLDIDKRAVQLSQFSLLMAARKHDSRILDKLKGSSINVFEIVDSRVLINLGYREQLKSLNENEWKKFLPLTKNEIDVVDYVFNAFKNGKITGSLTRVTAKDYSTIMKKIKHNISKIQISIFNRDFIEIGIPHLLGMLTVSSLLSSKYDVIVTNPPYLSPQKMDPIIKKYFTENYPCSKTDMYSMFLDNNLIKESGVVSLVVPDSWMYLDSYKNLRHRMLTEKMILSVIDIGMGAFDSTVQTMIITYRNKKTKSYYFNSCKMQDVTSLEELKKDQKYVNYNKDFLNMPGYEISYWIDDTIISSFTKGINIKQVADFKQGMRTGDTEKFTKKWFEVDVTKINFSCVDRKEALNSDKKWYPLVNGGKFRKWAGNIDSVINWYKDGDEIRNFKVNGKLKSRPQNLDYLFKEGLTWSSFSSKGVSIRTMPKGHAFAGAGYGIFLREESEYYNLLGFLNSSICSLLVKSLSSTPNFEVGVISALPYLKMNDDRVSVLVKRNIELSQLEWDSHENSYTYQTHPLLDRNDITLENYMELLFEKYEEYNNELRLNEYKIGLIYAQNLGINEDFIEMSENSDLFDYSKVQIINELISYFVGLIFGRYRPSPNMGDNPQDLAFIQVSDYLLESQNLSMIIRQNLMEFSSKYYKQNLNFISKTLNKNHMLSDEERLSKYLSNNFIKEHIKQFDKRPIYWMMTSGKLGAFKCLIYMHKYNEDTLAKINSELFLPELAKMKYEIDDIDVQIKHAEKNELRKLEKKSSELKAKYHEMQEYGLILDHMANRYINIDLDDGVKVNYSKFQGIEIVTDSGRKVKKDLFVPLK